MKIKKILSGLLVAALAVGTMAALPKGFAAGNIIEASAAEAVHSLTLVNDIPGSEWWAIDSNGVQFSETIESMPETTGYISETCDDFTVMFWCEKFDENYIPTVAVDGYDLVVSDEKQDDDGNFWATFSCDKCRIEMGGVIDNGQAKFQYDFSNVTTDTTVTFSLGKAYYQIGYFDISVGHATLIEPADGKIAAPVGHAVIKASTDIGFGYNGLTADDIEIGQTGNAVVANITGNDWDGYMVYIDNIDSDIKYIAFSPRIERVMTDEEVIAKLKSMIEKAIDSVIVSNNTTKEAYETAISNELATLEDHYFSLTPQIEFTKTNATESADGSISVTVTFSYKYQQNDVVSVIKVIPKLPAEEESPVIPTTPTGNTTSSSDTGTTGSGSSAPVIPSGTGTSSGTTSSSGGTTLKTDKNGKTYVSGSSGSKKNVTIPEKAAYVGNNAFKGNSKVTTVTVPASCEYIGKNAFSNCKNLTTVSIKGDTEIKDGAFKGCDKLTLIIEEGSPAEKYAQKNDIAWEHPKLTAPMGFKAKKTQNSVTLTWKKVNGAEGYCVYLYNEKTGKYEKYKAVSGEKCTIKGLDSGTKYKFKIAALDKKSNGKYKVGKSKTVSVTTK